MKKYSIIVILLIFCITLSFESCKKNNIDIDNNCASCEGKQVTEVLNNELAYVRTFCRDPLIFYFELSGQHDGIYVIPCAEIPQQYRIEGELVRISGNTTNCLGGGNCPYIRHIPINIFELTTIKPNTQ